VSGSGTRQSIGSEETGSLHQSRRSAMSRAGVRMGRVLYALGGGASMCTTLPRGRSSGRPTNLGRSSEKGQRSSGKGTIAPRSSAALTIAPEGMHAKASTWPGVLTWRGVLIWPRAVCRSYGRQPRGTKLLSALAATRGRRVSADATFSISTRCTVRTLPYHSLVNDQRLINLRETQAAPRQMRANHMTVTGPCLREDRSVLGATH
jgi:hypothetical protein